MSVGLDCNHQVPIPVRFIFQKLISPKSTTFMIFDVTVIPWDKIAPAKKLWDCNRSEKKQCREIQRKHSKDVTHFIGSWGQFPPVWVKLRQQSICHVPNRSSGLCCTGYTLHTSGEILTLAVISPLIHMAWTFLQGLKDATAFDETIKDLRLKQQQGSFSCSSHERMVQA